MNEALEKKFDEIWDLALKMGLDPFPVCFEEVPREIIWDTASYGLPTRMSHWSFGRTFQHQKVSGEMGYGKIYELIVNNNPSVAFLDETNDDVANLLIAAHCLGHSDFFKNNLVFESTNRNMVNQAEANAKRIDEFKEKYGVDTVEDWMDIAFSIDSHIDWRKGENRKKYPAPEHVFKTVKPLPFADLFGEDEKPQVIEEVINKGFPPHKEKDLLWFLINYAQMLPWQREVLSIIRSEMFYFYPYGQTKIMNEGWASYWHCELITNYWNMTPAEHLDFAQCHSKIVKPGGGGTVNPYYVGFKIFRDIKKRWDKYHEEGKKDKAFQASSEIDHYNEKNQVVMSKMDGSQKIRACMIEDDDISFVANYLTRELCEEMEMFTYGLEGVYENPEEDDIIIKDKALEPIKQALTNRLHNNGVPLIYITKADESGLHMEHDKSDQTPLDPLYAKKTMEFVHQVWKRPIALTTRDLKGDLVTYEITKHGVTETTSQSDGTTAKKFNI